MWFVSNEFYKNTNNHELFITGKGITQNLLFRRYGILGHSLPAFVNPDYYP